MMAVPSKETHQTMYDVEKKLNDAGEYLTLGSCNPEEYPTLKRKEKYPGT